MDEYDALTRCFEVREITSWLNKEVLCKLFLPPAIQSSIFRVEDTTIVQMIPLSLRDVELNNELLDFVNEIDMFKRKLGLKPTLNASFFQRGIKLVHNKIQAKLKNLQINKVQCVLRNHLYELMPKTKEQKRQLPAIYIELSSERSVTLQHKVRTGGWRKKVKQNHYYWTEGVGGQVERFCNIWSELKK